MTEASALSLYDIPEVQDLLELLNAPELQPHLQSYKSLLDYAETTTNQYKDIMKELSSMQGKIENLEIASGGIGARLQNLKSGIVSFTKDALVAVKEMGLSALGSVFDTLHVKDGLQAMSCCLAKSVERLDNTVAKICELEKHNQDKAAVSGGEETQSSEKRISLAELLEGTRVDFESLSQVELVTVYEELLEIGKNHELTATENVCLEHLVEEVSDLLPNRGEYELAHEAENEVNRGEEIDQCEEL